MVRKVNMPPTRQYLVANSPRLDWRKQPWPACQNVSIAGYPKTLVAVDRANDYAADREYTRESVFYYYCSSLTRTIDQFPSLELPAEWSHRIATTLLERQQPDGSWTNPAVDVREDDPLVATPLAIESLLTIAK